MEKFILAALLFCASWAHSDSKFQGKHVVVELLSENKSIASGEPFDVGVHFTMDPEWHVYWINPGDSGEAPRITWNVPGYVAGPIQWPQPAKIFVGPLADYGYSKDILLISTLTPNAPVSKKSIPIKAEVKWLVCREVCIPGKAEISLDVPISTIQPSKDAVLFKSTRQNTPVVLPPHWTVKGESLTNSFKIQMTGPEEIKTAEFFPLNALQVDAPSPQEWSNGQLTIKKNEQLDKAPLTLDGLLKIGDHSFKVSIPVEQAAAAPTVSLKYFLTMLLFAFGGGLLLNLMPCVFPVLSMKVFGFLKMSGAEKKKLRWHAWIYTAGILVSFWVLVGALLILKASGQKLGWGFQLQSPPFVSFLSAILFLFGLSLVGVFEISGSFTGAGNSLARKEGLTGVFFTGVLATLVSTPCTAPFMGAAVGFALSQPPLIGVIVFSSLALGLAFPYILLSYVPAIGALLPRPGPWMETLKQVTGFLIFATVIWLISVVALQTPPSFLVVVMGSLLLMGMAAWVLRRWSSSRAGRFIAILLILFSLFVAASPSPLMGLKEPAVGQKLMWEDYSLQALDNYRKQGRPVFIDFTAAWCISCKVNELVVFGSDKVISKLKETHMVLMRADWTSHDEAITKALESFGRSGVPAYVIYTKESQAPQILPELITPGLVLDALDQIKL